MSSFNNLRIGTRLIVLMTALVMLLVIAISSIISYKVQQTLRDSTETISRESAFHYAYIVKAELEIALDEVRSLATTVEEEINTGNASSIYPKLNNTLKYFLEKRPSFFGVKLALESSNVASKEEIATESGYNSNGQFAPYWLHDVGNKISLHPVTNYEIAPWYVAMRNG